MTMPNATSRALLGAPTVEVRRFSLTGHTPAHVRRVLPVLDVAVTGGDAIEYSNGHVHTFPRFASVRVGPRTWRALHRDAAGAWYVYERANFRTAADWARAARDLDAAAAGGADA